MNETNTRGHEIIGGIPTKTTAKTGMTYSAEEA